MVNCTWQDGRVFSDPLAPCGPVNSTNPVAACCAVGDVCLSDGICYTMKSLPDGTGFYTAACSNGGNYSDGRYSSICPDRCGDDLLPDIKYVSDTTWVCCGVDENGNRNCEDPTNEAFNAAAQSDLATLWTAGVSSPTSSAVVSSATSATPTETGHQTSSTNNGLSTGAQAGIGVGVAVGGLAVIFIAAFFFLRRRKQGLEETTEVSQPTPFTELPPSSPRSELPEEHKPALSRFELQ